MLWLEEIKERWPQLSEMAEPGWGPRTENEGREESGEIQTKSAVVYNCILYNINVLIYYNAIILWVDHVKQSRVKDICKLPVCVCTFSVSLKSFQNKVAVVETDGPVQGQPELNYTVSPCFKNNLNNLI